MPQGTDACLCPCFGRRGRQTSPNAWPCAVASPCASQVHLRGWIPGCGGAGLPSQALQMQAQSQANLPPKTQRRRLTNQKPEPRPTSAPRTSRNSIAPSVQRLSDRRAPPVVSGDRCLALPLWSATAAYCCSVLLVACMTYCKPTFLDQWQSVVQPYLGWLGFRCS